MFKDLTDDTLLVKVQWLLVCFWENTTLCEFLVHDLADGAVGTVSTNDQVARVRGLVHTRHRHIRRRLGDINHALAGRQLMCGNLGQQELMKIRPGRL